MTDEFSERADIDNQQSLLAHQFESRILSFASAACRKLASDSPPNLIGSGIVLA
jgi:hypothetical protein